MLHHATEARSSFDAAVPCPIYAPPLLAPPPPPGRQVYLSGKVSSQYLTALLMAAPLAVPGGPGGDAIEVVIKDELVSQPYVDMTVKLMERFGVKVERLDGLQHLRVGAGDWGVGDRGVGWGGAKGARGGWGGRGPPGERGVWR